MSTESIAYRVATLANGTCHLIDGLGRLDRAIRAGESREDLLLILEAITLEYSELTKELR